MHIASDQRLFSQKALCLRGWDWICPYKLPGDLEAYRQQVETVGFPQMMCVMVFFVSHCGMVLAMPDEHSLQVYADVRKESSTCCRCCWLSWLLLS